MTAACVFTHNEWLHLCCYPETWRRHWRWEWIGPSVRAMPGPRTRSTVRNMEECFKLILQKYRREQRREVYHRWGSVAQNLIKACFNCIFESELNPISISTIIHLHAVLYSGKFLREKTFKICGSVGSEYFAEDIHGMVNQLHRWVWHVCNFMEKIFAGGLQITKFVKFFSLDPLYGI